MIKVTKDLTKIPAHLTSGGNDYNHQDVKVALIGIYHNKCCYCEHKAGAFEIEHYRPKKAPKGKRPTHSGYPWLILEWSNLLWACVSCNRGPGAKHNKFPIANQANRRNTPPTNPADKVVTSTWLGAEGAMLLHPEIDNPEEHLTVLPNGKLTPIDNSLRGKETIKICNLNRDLLWVNERKNVIDEICKMLRNQVIQAAKVISNYSIQNQQDKDKILLMLLGTIFEHIKNNCTDSSEFALLHRVFYKKFNEFIDFSTYIQNAIGQNLINIIKQTFVEYKLQNP